jgi:hypothetical protein
MGRDCAQTRRARRTCQMTQKTAVDLHNKTGSDVHRREHDGGVSRKLGNSSAVPAPVCRQGAPSQLVLRGVRILAGPLALRAKLIGPLLPLKRQRWAWLGPHPTRKPSKVATGLLKYPSAQPSGGGLTIYRQSFSAPIPCLSGKHGERMSWQRATGLRSSMFLTLTDTRLTSPRTPSRSENSAVAFWREAGSRRRGEIGHGPHHRRGLRRASATGCEERRCSVSQRREAPYASAPSAPRL